MTLFYGKYTITGTVEEITQFIKQNELVSVSNVGSLIQDFICDPEKENVDSCKKEKTPESVLEKISK